MSDREFVSVDDLFRMPSTSHAVVAGRDVWVQGLLGFEGGGTSLVSGGVGAEVTQACINLERILAVCDANLDDVVRVDVLLVDTRDFLELDTALSESLPVRPARTVAYVAELPVGARVEITARALRRDEER